jgi:hypothetical protein
MPRVQTRPEAQGQEPEQPTNRRGDRNESLTVLRACEVLKAFRSRGEELSLADVIERASLPKTTAFRLLRTLIHGGLIEPAFGGYRNRFDPVTERPFRIGFAAQGDSAFSRSVLQSIETAAFGATLGPDNQSILRPKTNLWICYTLDKHFAGLIDAATLSNEPNARGLLTRVLDGSKPLLPAKGRDRIGKKTRPTMRPSSCRRISSPQPIREPLHALAAAVHPPRHSGSRWAGDAFSCRRHNADQHRSRAPYRLHSVPAHPCMVCARGHITLNGKPYSTVTVQGTWAAIKRMWRAGDRIELTLPQAFHIEAIDDLHPETVAVMRGPVQYVALNPPPNLARVRMPLPSSLRQVAPEIFVEPRSDQQIIFVPLYHVQNQSYATYFTRA